MYETVAQPLEETDDFESANFGFDRIIWSMSEKNESKLYSVDGASPGCAAWHLMSKQLLSLTCIIHERSPEGLL
jgi:hypothetical protein